MYHANMPLMLKHPGAHTTYSNCMLKVTERCTRLSLILRTHRYNNENKVTVAEKLTLLWYHGVNVTPVLFDSRLFF